MKRNTVVLGAMAAVLALSSTDCVPMRQEVRGDEVKVHYNNPQAASKPAPVHEAGDWKNELEGLASWYGVDFNGRMTASGEVYDMYAMTAAHKTLPLGTVVRVFNLENGKKAKVRINDRGPYVEGRVIDLSRKAARALGMRDNGTARVRIEVLKLP